MIQYTVEGMSCAACQSRVEKAVEKVEGVTSCAVSLLTNSMGVEGDVSPDAVIAAVENAGYSAYLKEDLYNYPPEGALDSSDIQSMLEDVGEGDNDQSRGSGKGTFSEGSRSGNRRGGDPLEDKETPVLAKRLTFSLFFLLILLYFSMGHSMFGFPIPYFLVGNPIGIGLLQLLLAGIVMVINQKFFISGTRSLLHRSPNMDTLVALGAGASFIYSVVVLFNMTVLASKGNTEAAAMYAHDFYFESAGTILTLITVGKMLEAYSKGKTTGALKSLMKLAPQTARILRDDKEIVVPIQQVAVGDIFLVKPGEQMPVDGVVIEGSCAVDEAALTGESIPVDKEVDSRVSAGTLSKSGFIKAKALRVGRDTTLSQIIKMVSDAAATKAPIAKAADRISSVFVPVVVGIACATFVIWMIATRDVGFSLGRAISVLVISCPCALGLATPVAIMVGSGVGARGGILFKTASSLEETGRTKIVCLDKTGTITKGEPSITDIMPVGDMAKVQLLQLAYTLEQYSEHPLAGAIIRGAEERGIYPEPITEFKVLPGNGVEAYCEGHLLQGGSLSYMNKITRVSELLQSMSEILGEQGKTPLYFAMDGEVQGIIAVADTIKEDSAKAIKELRNMGIRVVMLTGDNRATASAVGREAGVDEVIAGVLPDGKEEAVRRMMKFGKTAMVGDGINDAPALTVADTGIAIGAGTDVAIDAANVVLMNSTLMDVPAAIRLSRGTLKNIHENLFWAFIYNVIGIPLAAGVLIPVIGLKLNPMFGAAAMSLSSFCVVTNALRLNLLRIRDARRDKKMTPVIIESEMAENEAPPEDVAAGVTAAGDTLTADASADEDMSGEAPDMISADEALAGSSLADMISAGGALEGNEPADTPINYAGDDPAESDPQITVNLPAVEEGEAEGEDLLPSDPDLYSELAQNTKENTAMEKTFNVEGMMCAHCEGAVKAALEAMEGIVSAKASHETNTVVVSMDTEVSDDAIKAVIEGKGYKVV